MLLWWLVNKYKEPKEKPDLMPFAYIGFAGLVGYLLIRSQ